MLAKFKAIRKEREEAFTLIELLVVILIIGILAAIAIPLFLNQRMTANDGAVESDLRNAATAVETEAITKKSYVALSQAEMDGLWTRSAGVTLALASTSDKGFCLTARHENGKNYKGDSVATYDSLAGGLNTKGGACAANTNIGGSGTEGSPSPGAGANGNTGDAPTVEIPVGGNDTTQPFVPGTTGTTEDGVPYTNIQLASTFNQASKFPATLSVKKVEGGGLDWTFTKTNDENSTASIGAKVTQYTCADGYVGYNPGGVFPSFDNSTTATASADPTMFWNPDGSCEIKNIKVAGDMMNSIFMIDQEYSFTF